MIAVQVRAKEATELAKRLGQYDKRMVAALARFLARVTLKLQKDWKVEARERPPFFEGSLANSIDRSGVVHSKKGGEIVFTGRVFTPLIHGAVVDFGRKPGRWPPREAIEHWVRVRARQGWFKKMPLGPKKKRGVKNVGQGRDTAGRYESRFQIGFGLVNRSAAERREMGIKTLAFLISRKIATKGIRRKMRLARLVLKRARRAIQSELTLAVRQAFRDTVKGK